MPDKWIKCPSYNELVRTLQATSRALQVHIDDEAKRAMLVPDVLCPCTDHELNDAYRVLAGVDAEAVRDGIRKYAVIDTDEYVRFQCDTIDEALNKAGKEFAVFAQVYVLDRSELTWTPDDSDTWPPDNV